MSWYWFGWSPPGSNPLASAPARREDGTVAGELAAWPAHDEGHADTKIDARTIDPGGPAMWISLVLVPAERRILFDDPAVSNVLRAVLQLPAADAISTLLVGDDTFGGAVTIVDDRSTGRIDDDPFARLGRAEILRVDDGLFGFAAAPTGPVIQRYGSGNPWPWDRF